MRCLLLCWCLSMAPLSAAVVGSSTAPPPLTRERIDTLPRAQRTAWKEYLERSTRRMAADKSALHAEVKAAGLAVPVEGPSGSAARSIPLDKPAAWYAGADARRLADIVLSFQTPAGGWSKNLNLADHARRPGESWAANNTSRFLSPGDLDAPHDVHWSYIGTLDNDATTAEMRFLAKVAANIPPADAVAYRAAFLRGLDYLFAAQYPNGGWPQVWPLEGGYHDAVTFNDSAVTQALEVLQAAAHGEDDYAFVPEAVRKRARASFDRGIACILAAQIKVNGRRTVWGQQHDALTLEPVAARNYEPAAQSSSESAGLLLLLMSLEAPRAEVAAAIEAGIAWLEKTAIRDKAFTRGPNGRLLVDAPGQGPLWARFYAIGTDRPLFGDRDKTIHDDVSEISLERRNGYSWYTAAPEEALKRWARYRKH